MITPGFGKQPLSSEEGHLPPSNINSNNSKYLPSPNSSSTEEKENSVPVNSNQRYPFPSSAAGAASSKQPLGPVVPFPPSSSSSSASPTKRQTIYELPFSSGAANSSRVTHPELFNPRSASRHISSPPLFQAQSQFQSQPQSQISSLYQSQTSTALQASTASTASTINAITTAIATGKTIPASAFRASTRERTASTPKPTEWISPPAAAAAGLASSRKASPTSSISPRSSSNETTPEGNALSTSAALPATSGECNADWLLKGSSGPSGPPSAIHSSPFTSPAITTPASGTPPATTATTNYGLPLPPKSTTMQRQRAKSLAAPASSSSSPSSSSSALMQIDYEDANGQCQEGRNGASPLQMRREVEGALVQTQKRPVSYYEAPVMQRGQPVRSEPIAHYQEPSSQQYTVPAQPEFKEPRKPATANSGAVTQQPPFQEQQQPRPSTPVRPTSYYRPHHVRQASSPNVLQASPAGKMERAYSQPEGAGSGSMTATMGREGVNGNLAGKDVERAFGEMIVGLYLGTLAEYARGSNEALKLTCDTSSVLPGLTQAPFYRSTSNVRPRPTRQNRHAPISRRYYPSQYILQVVYYRRRQHVLLFIIINRSQC